MKGTETDKELLRLPYRDRIRGQYQQLQVVVTSKAKALPWFECTYVNILLPETSPQGVANGEVYLGDINGQFRKLLPLTMTDYQPISNPEQYFMRTVLAATDVGYAPVFVIVEVLF